MTNKSNKSVTQAAINSKSTFASYEPLLTRSDISFEKRHAWLVVGNPEFNDKLVMCLSISLKHAVSILTVVLPILKQHEVSFILVADQLQHNRINNHAFPLELFGKPLIIFPKNLDITKRLLKDLLAVTNDFSALVLPNCLQVGNICYVAFTTRISYDVNEQFPYKFIITKELSEYLYETAILKKTNISRFIGGRHIPFKLILSSHKGNIIKGIDIRTMRWSFIKQARDWAGEDIHGRQMRDRLYWQMSLANILQDQINVPKAIQLIESSHYSYLITEYIDGQSLDALIKTGKSDVSNILFIIKEAAIQIQQMHAFGYIHRDITAKNIIFSASGKVYLTDLELAYPINGAMFPPFESGTIGYMSTQQTLGLDPHPADDVFAFGALLYFAFSNEHPRSLCNISEEVRNNKIYACGAPHDIQNFIQASQSNFTQHRPQIQELVAILQKESDNVENNAFYTEPIFSLKKQIAKSLIIILLAVLSVYILWQTSGESNLQGNGFERMFLNPPVQPSKEINLPIEVAYIAGLYTDSIYLTSTNQGQLFSIGKNDSRLNKSTPFAEYQFKSQIESKSIISVTPYGKFLINGTGKTLVSKGIIDSSIKITTTSEPFSRAIPINDSLVILRKAKPGIRDQVLYLINQRNSQIVREARVTPKRHDGGYSTAGLLAYDTVTRRAAYVTRYANQITMLDHRLNILTKTSSIDTFSSYRTQVANVKSRNSETVSNKGPQLYVNRSIAMNEGILFIKSAVLADNENTESQRSMTVLDLYDQLDGKYFGSVRLDKGDGSRLRNFAVSDNKIYCLYPQRLKIYNIPSIPMK